MSEPIKLKNPGESITFTVTSCTKVPVGRYPEWEFVGREINAPVRMPESAFTRQLARLNETAESIVGKRVTIGRSENKSDPSKPYWDLEVSGSGAKATTGGASNGAAAGTTQPPAAPVQAPAPKDEKPSALYASVTDHVLTSIVPRYQKAGIEVTDRGVAAIVATLFIAATNGRH